MTRVIAALLSLSLALAPALARAQDAGTPPPPGRATEVAPCEEPGPAGEPQPCPGEGRDASGAKLQRIPGVPYRGSLMDRQRVGTILAKRVAAEMDRDAARLEFQNEQAEHARTRQQRDEARAASGPSWGTMIGVTGAALVLGLVGGVVATLAVQDRAK